LSTTVLQGSVATRVNYGKIFNDIFIANLLLSVMVKEFWRSLDSAKLRQKIKWHLFFRTRCKIWRYRRVPRPRFPKRPENFGG